MKLAHNLFFVCAFILSGVITAQQLTNTEMLEFYPNNAGNSWSYLWVYHDIENDYYEGGRETIVIPKDTTVKDMQYRLMESEENGYGIYEYYLERIDTLTGDVIRINDIYSDEQSLVDNIYAGIGDTISITNNRFLLYCDKIVVLSIRATVINDFATTIREVVGLPGNKKLFFARNIGLLGAGPNYWIDSARVNGNIFSNISYALTDVKDNNETFEPDFILLQNYPNPFNPTTVISYKLSVFSKVQLKVYDVLGREISTLVNEEKQAGDYTVDFYGADIPSGIYFYQLKANGFTQTKKMTLMK